MAVVASAKKSGLRLCQFDFNFKQEYEAQHQQAIAIIGLDEVGRGSLIGPVMAAAVYWPQEILTNETFILQYLRALNDSKKLSALQREALKPVIEEKSLWAVAHATQTEVETLNVAQASLLATRRALEKVLEQLPKTNNHKPFVLLDGKMALPGWPLEQQQALVKGDGLSASIAAASILAKQARDRWVLEQAKQYPHYGWQTNMGYATQAHQAAIVAYGTSPLHRSTFELKAKQLSLSLVEA